VAFDEEIAGHDRATIVFTDVSAEVDDEHRVAYEPNRANVEKQCQTNRVFLPDKDC